MRFTILSVLSSFAIILLMMRGLVALLLLCSCCHGAVNFLCLFLLVQRSADGNVSRCRYLSHCRSRGREFDPILLVKIDHEIIFTAILFPSADSRRVFVSYK